MRSTSAARLAADSAVRLSLRRPRVHPQRAVCPALAHDDVCTGVHTLLHTRTHTHTHAHTRIHTDRHSRPCERASLSTRPALQLESRVRHPALLCTSAPHTVSFLTADTLLLISHHCTHTHLTLNASLPFSRCPTFSAVGCLNTSSMSVCSACSLRHTHALLHTLTHTHTRTHTRAFTHMHVHTQPLILQPSRLLLPPVSSEQPIRERRTRTRSHTPLLHSVSMSLSVTHTHTFTHTRAHMRRRTRDGHINRTGLGFSR